MRSSLLFRADSALEENDGDAAVNTQTIKTFGTLYILSFVNGLLTGKFGTPAQNDAIAAELDQTLQQMKDDYVLAGGTIIKFNGPASLPVTAVLTHHLAHLYGAIAFRDPKVFVAGDEEYTIPGTTEVIKTKLDADGKPVPAYIVAISHNDYKVGQIIA
jgi:CRISPR-associated protein Csx3